MTRPLWRPSLATFFGRGLNTHPHYNNIPTDDGFDTFHHPSASRLTPRQLAQYLDDYVVGQPDAKKVLSVAVYNHYNRVRANFSPLRSEPLVGWPHHSALSNRDEPHDRLYQPATLPSLAPTRLPGRQALPVFEKSNILILGPTGSGKTLLTQTLAKIIDVPFSISDATAFTQAGYVGEDVEMCIRRLLQSSKWDAHRASTGIVYIDEIDKLARRDQGSGGSRDVGGEGVQQALLRMMEGGIVTIHTKSNTWSQSDSISTTTMDVPRSGINSPKQETFHVDTSNVLFIMSGAFVGLEDVINRRLAQRSIGFTAELRAPVATHNSVMSAPANKDALGMVNSQDLVKYGFIPEFVSRLPVVTSLAALKRDDLVRILTDVRGSLVSQYVSLFAFSGVELRFTTSALREIAATALERGGAARALRGIMEHILLDSMYETPGSGIRHVLVNRSVAKGTEPALYWSRGEGAAFWAAWAEEEAAGEAACTH